MWMLNPTHMLSCTTSPGDAHRGAWLELRERDRLGARYDLFDDLGSTHDRGTLRNLVLSDVTRFRARAAKPDLSSIVDELLVQVLQYRHPFEGDPIGASLSAQPHTVHSAQDDCFL